MDNISDIKAHIAAPLAAITEYFDELGSTNTYLKLRAPEIARGAVVADSQTCGRGRNGRGFFSPAGCGVYLSYLFKPQNTERISALTGCAAVAVADAIESVCGVSVNIKWVNDLLIGTKKVCGILAESVVGADGTAVIVGVGVNANTPAGAFPEEIRGHASSIWAETGVNVSRAKLAAEIIKNLDGLCTAFPDGVGQCLEKYRERCVSVGKDALILHDNEKERVFAESISDDFGLVVRCADGTRKTVTTGEVSVRGLYGYV